MRIENDRSTTDWDTLRTTRWSGVLVGTDGYPHVKHSDWSFGVLDEKSLFKAIAIEFYGVKLQT